MLYFSFGISPLLKLVSPLFLLVLYRRYHAKREEKPASEEWGDIAKGKHGSTSGQN
jgi:hypothetical protein